jgi:hypothetical protein
MVAVDAVVAGAVAFVTACGAPPSGSATSTASVASTSSSAASSSAASSSAASATATCGPGGSPGVQSGPVDASFVSGSAGWLLDETFNDCTQHGTVAVYKTTDGGLKWTKVTAPAAPWGGGPVTSPDSVSAVLFANAKDGWAYGPALWATHNGGASWHQVSTHGYEVYSMAATGTSVLAAFDGCGEAGPACENPETFKVETAEVHTDTWRAVPGAAGKGTASLSAQAGTAYAFRLVSSPPPVYLGLLTGPANGSRAWHAEATPCAQGAIADSAATASHVLLACALLGAHPATTHLYSSTNSGATWKQFATLGLYDGASVIEETPNGTLLAGGIYGIELSRNGGRTWTSPVVDTSPAIGGGSGIMAALTTNADGYLIAWENAVWITRDGGRTWKQVKVG